ncbi:hypothetical protein ACFVUW_00635 [Streptomyces xiamenensis]|uniref:hypothetical protein n=1 Tax=Streptomyces xiamenensis TaxID=408015 RepID=UPI0036E4FBFB
MLDLDNTLIDRDAAFRASCADALAQYGSSALAKALLSGPPQAVTTWSSSAGEAVGRMFRTEGRQESVGGGQLRCVGRQVVAIHRMWVRANAGRPKTGA